MAVLLRRYSFAGVTTRALAVVESAIERMAEHVPIPLRMRVMTIDARHRAIQIAVAVEMVALVPKGTHPAIHGVGVFELGKSEREEFLQRIPWQIGAVANNLFGRVTLKTHHERLIFLERGERFHADVFDLLV